MFEFLIATPGTARAGSRRIETEGLGYAHLLELAVILAAIPDLTHVTPPIASPPPDSSEDADLTPEERERLMRAAEVNAAVEGETFFAGSFHAVVILEEPEHICIRNYNAGWSPTSRRSSRIAPRSR